MKKIEINTEYIKLQQILKYEGIVSSGSEAAIIIKDKKVKVNDEIEIRRGRKLYNNDIIDINNIKYIIKKI